MHTWSKLTPALNSLTHWSVSIRTLDQFSHDTPILKHCSYPPLPPQNTKKDVQKRESSPVMWHHPHELTYDVTSCQLNRTSRIHLKLLFLFGFRNIAWTPFISLPAWTDQMSKPLKVILILLLWIDKRHIKKLSKYLLDRGGVVVLGSIVGPWSQLIQSIWISGQASHPLAPAA